MKPPVFFLLPFAAFLFPLASLGASEWPQFRGPDGNGLSSAKNVPTQWSAASSLAWRVEVPGNGWSSPVISGDKVFLTSAVSDAAGEVSLNAVCFDASNGKVLWNREVFRPEPGEVKAMHKKNTAASPTAIVDGGKVYVHFGHMGTAALDLDGNVLWKQSSLKYKPVHGTGGSPALVNGMLVYSGDGTPEPFVAALDAATGSVRWNTPRNTGAKKTFSFSTPQAITVNAGVQIVSPGSGFVAAYNPNDGKELWRVNYGEGYSVVPRPVYAHGLLFLSSGFDAASLYAIKPEGAVGDATSDHVAWTLKKAAPHTPSVVVVDDSLFCVSDAGIASCIDPLTGDVRWSERLAGNFSASPIVAEGRIYFLNETGATHIVSAKKSFELINTNEIGERTLASPAVVDGALYVRGETHLFKIAR